MGSCSPCVVSLDKAQEHLNDHLLANRSIQHGMINRAIRPLRVKVFLDEIGALAIDGIHEIFGFFFIFPTGQEPPDFVFSRGIEKRAEGTGQV